MTNKKISTVVESQIPSHIREDYPIFVQFLKNYYEFMEQGDGAVGSLSKLLYNSEFESMDPEFMLKLKQELALPLNIAMKDSKVFASNLKALFAAKGTEEAFRILFRMLFDEEIIISYPRDRILRASDGLWVQESFLTINTISGAIPTNNLDFRLEITHEDSTSETHPTRIERTSATSYRAYFTFTYRVDIYVGDRVEAINDAGQKIFVGTVGNSPAKIRVISPGKFWQVGKVVTIEAEGKSSVARVKKVGPEGQLLALDVLEYGFPHTPGTIYYVSPLRKPPQSSVVSIESTITGISPLTYNHTIQILDVLDSLTETIRGYGNDEGTSDSYFLEQYNTEGYSGTLVVEYDDIVVVAPQATQEVSYSTWLDSRTSLEFDFQPKTSLVGYWAGDGGKLSNPFVRLQDNYFYQVFSYLIDTESDISWMPTIEKLVGPAGLKPFFNSNKQNIADVTGNISITRRISNERLFFFDVIGLEDQTAKHTEFGLEDYIESIGDFATRNTSLDKSDDFWLPDNSTRMVGLRKSEVTTFTETTTKQSDVALVDVFESDDSQLERHLSLVKFDTQTMTDNPAKEISFGLEDEFVVYDYVGEYGTEYFAENYTTDPTATNIQISTE